MKKLLLIVLLFFTSYSQISQISSRTFTGEFPVTINGSNFKSGVYYVYPATRVLDVLKRAADTLSFEDIPRDIKVDGVSIDVFQYLFKNDQTQNPVVTPGMNIFAEFPAERVTIKGDILNKVEKLTIHKNEKLDAFMNLFSLSSTADSTFIYLIRDNKSEKIQVSDYGTILLKDQDYIVVPENKTKLPPCMVEVKGEVNKPGLYAIEHGETQLKELIPEIDILPTGSLSRICIYRKIKIEQLQSPRQEVVAGLKNMAGNYTSFYVDTNQILNDKDVIEVLKTDSFVYVNGFVARPSGIEYKDGLEVRDYIKRAGGFSKSADKVNVRVLTSCGMNYQIRDIKKIQPGDVILVPEASESKWIKTWTPIISVIGSTASIIAAVINLSR
jgi:protein involved in polysaccharide export with SLBB domain